MNLVTIVAQLDVNWCWGALSEECLLVCTDADK
jgi:hypothetical protein